MGRHLQRTMDVDEESWHMLIQSMLLAGGLAMCALISHWIVRPARTTNPYWI
jgi:predicted Zn-dependent protease